MTSHSVQLNNKTMLQSANLCIVDGLIQMQLVLLIANELWLSRIRILVGSVISAGEVCRNVTLKDVEVLGSKIWT